MSLYNTPVHGVMRTQHINLLLICIYTHAQVKQISRQLITDQYYRCLIAIIMFKTQ